MSLTFNLVKLAADTEPHTIEGSMDWNDIADNRADIVRVEPLQVRAQAEFGGGVADVKGTSESSVIFACSRCLKPVRSTVRFTFREMYTREQHMAEADEEGHLHPVHGEEVDLRPMLRENLWLELPQVCLCDQDCKGMCPQCGQNWNDASCGCNTERIDPRLAGLKDFFN